MDCDELDRLYDRIVEHYEWQRRVKRRWLTSSPNEPISRCAQIRYGGGAVRLLEISTVAVAPFPDDKRPLTWTRNVGAESGYAAPEDERGSTVTELSAFDQAIAVIEGESSP